MWRLYWFVPFCKPFSTRFVFTSSFISSLVLLAYSILVLDLFAYFAFFLRCDTSSREQGSLFCLFIISSDVLGIFISLGRVSPKCSKFYQTKMKINVRQKSRCCRCAYFGHAALDPCNCGFRLKTPRH